MKIRLSCPLSALLLFSILFCAPTTRAENLTEQAPITMEQLMRELRIQGGNWVFRFDRPVFAKVVCTVSAFPDAKTSEVTEFVSDKPDQEVSLFFTASAFRVGEHPMPNKLNERKMMVKLSNCKATDGTRIVHYFDKFSGKPWVGQEGQRGEYSPCLALNPELKKEYVLHYYYREGDPYEAKATICFFEKLEDAANVEPFRRGTPRTWKSVTDGR